MYDGYSWCCSLFAHEMKRGGNFTKAVVPYIRTFHSSELLCCTRAHFLIYLLSSLALTLLQMDLIVLRLLRYYLPPVTAWATAWAARVTAGLFCCHTVLTGDYLDILFESLTP